MATQLQEKIASLVQKSLNDESYPDIVAPAKSSIDGKVEFSYFDSHKDQTTEYRVVMKIDLVHRINNIPESL